MAAANSGVMRFWNRMNIQPTMISAAKATTSLVVTPQRGEVVSF